MSDTQCLDDYLDALSYFLMHSDGDWHLFQRRTGLQCTQRQYVKSGRNARDRMLRRAARRRGRGMR